MRVPVQAVAPVLRPVPKMPYQCYEECVVTVEAPPTNETSEVFHISSFVVRCLPDRLSYIMDTVGSFPGVEIHGSDPCGKFVALLELDSEKALIETITNIELIKGVVNTSMVYHHVE